MDLTFSPPMTTTKKPAKRATKDELANRNLSVLLTPSVFKKLQSKAKANGRTVSGEARHLINQYVEAA